MKKKIALIFGVTGQDGAYLSKFLLKKGYIVHGVKRRSSSINATRLDDIYSDPLIKKNNFYLHYGDVTDSISVFNIISKVKPDEIYNLAAQSHVAVSFESPEYTANSDGIGTLRILEALRTLKMIDKTKFYQASTSELYGLVQETPQNEKTSFYPRSPYGVAKLYAYWIIVNYREAYGIYACNGILFNHESPRRGETFITRKITRGLSRIHCNLEETLYVGNLNARRDWGHAKDFIKMQWLMLQQDEPKDYVIATGKQISVRDFIEISAKALGWKGIKWIGEGLNEVGLRCDTNEVVIKVDPRYFRPTEVESLLGDASKAKKELGWEPTINVENLIKEMLANDLKKCNIDKLIKEKNFELN